MNDPRAAAALALLALVGLAVLVPLIVGFPQGPPAPVFPAATVGAAMVLVGAGGLLWLLLDERGPR